MKSNNHITDDQAALDLCLRLARVHAMMVRRFDRSLSGVHGISFGDFQLLSHLGRAPGCRLRRVDLAERHGLSASGITRTLLPLEKIGLVARQPDPRDARVGYAVLTAAGRRILEEAEGSARLAARDLLRQADPARLASLAPLLAQIAGLPADTEAGHG